LAATLWLHARRANPDIIYRGRNFYGVLTVFEHRKDEPRGHHYLLQHGRITHGLQLADPQLQRLATTYFGNQSGLGLALKAMTQVNRRIGIVGLGTGTIATYARAGDFLHFYEINPAVKELAARPFTYLNKCSGTWEITPGDARLSLENEPSQNFDLLALDAFSGDAIPVHLLTREAFALYLSHLNTNGLLAVHISNHFLDLEPVVLRQADEFGLHAVVIDHDADPAQWWIYSSTWVLLSRDDQLLASPSIRANARPKVSSRHVPVWTDDYCSVFEVVR
jgi:spermidine synthase